MDSIQEKIKYLEEEIEKLRAVNRQKSAQIESLMAEKEESRKCSSFCEYCVHGIKTEPDYRLCQPNHAVYGQAVLTPMPGYLCVLDCKCKDFERRELKP